MKDLILFPFGGNAKEAVSAVRALNVTCEQWNLLGFVDDNPNTWDKSLLDFPVLGGRDVFAKYPKANVLAVPGRASNFLQRPKLIAALELDKSRFATLVHPTARIGPNVHLGHNTLLMEGVTATANVTIGNHCVVLPNTVLSHDCSIGDYTMIGSNVSISGSVGVGRCCYLGSGSKLIEEIEIGEETLIGLGSVVLRSTEPSSVLVGNPAKPLRHHP